MTPNDSADPELSSRWGLAFEKVPTGRGTTEMGLAGDLTRKGRRLDGAVRFDADNRIRSVLCQAGGTEVNLVTGEVNQQFLYDCASPRRGSEARPVDGRRGATPSGEGTPLPGPPPR
jgi:hypothetical protein